MDASANIPLNAAINLNSIIEDKPPEYKELFPINQNAVSGQIGAALNQSAGHDQAERRLNVLASIQENNVVTRVEDVSSTNLSQNKFTSV